MKVVKCVNGHFFDEDKYEQCPHCGGLTSSGAATTTTASSDKKEESTDDGEKKKKHRFFGGKKKEGQAEAVVEQTAQSTTPASQMLNQPVLQMYSGQMPSQQVSQMMPQQMAAPQMMGQAPEMDDDRTVLIEPVTPPASVMERPPVFDAGQASQVYSQMPQSIPVSQMMPQPMATPQAMPMQQPMPSQYNQGDNMQTVAFYDSVVEPVTGWLVCIKGESYGESFEIKAGRNNIGRGTNMDVPLLKEMSVSRDKHAVIVFDPINLKFIMQSGENGLTYVNDELLMGVKELKANDKIMMGTAIFMFIPFCGENFDWKDHQNN